jgi:hypothetical protein
MNNEHLMQFPRKIPEQVLLIIIFDELLKLSEYIIKPISGASILSSGTRNLLSD